MHACVCHGPAHYLFAFLTLTILTFDFDVHASCVADILLHVHKCVADILLHMHNKWHPEVQLGRGQPSTEDLRYTVYLSTKVLKWIAKK